ncbi:hypothetical protein [Persicobacter sp. CCB-QB2]|uniref:hypothetical protein n=1 Tax=Persicobacter sp. CCB-QB2 TaxID=1561025 RepID=UPI0006A9739F|nr:hypothetical protein [Persicobacter sp. CCB-QB2]
MNEKRILDGLSNLVKSVSEESFIGIVKQVDEKEMVAQVEYDELLFDVQLRAVADSDQSCFVQVPAIGSYVVAAPVGHDKERCVLLIASVVEKVIYQGKKTSLIIDDVEEKIIFNNADKGSFMTDINELVDKLNTIERDINSLKTAFSNWVTAPNDGGAALKAITASWAGQQLTPTKVDDISDESIEH